MSNTGFYEKEPEYVSRPDNTALQHIPGDYGWPLLGALLGAAAGLSRSEASAAALALCGMLAGWLLARRSLRKPRCLQQLSPVISA